MKNNYLNPYDSVFPKIVRKVKIYLQFIIGFILICILTVKGVCEVFETFDFMELLPLNNIVIHMLGIDTFSYIANTLAISAGIELGYMLFTDGPDETIEPLMLGVTSAAFYTLSADSGGSWVLGIYALSILVLMYCLKKYKDWNLGHDDHSRENRDLSSYDIKVQIESDGSYIVDVESTVNK